MADLKVALAELWEDTVSGAIRVKPEHTARRPPQWMAIAAALVAAMTASPLTSYSGHAYSPSFSPEGNQVAFKWDG